MNRVLLLMAYRCFETKSDSYSGEFFQNNETLSKIFKVSQKQINTIIQRLVSNGWISIRNEGSPHRKIKLTDKTKELIYYETESIIDNPEILLGTIGNSNSNQNFSPLGTIGNSYSNQNFTHKRTRKETLKELSKSDRESFEKIQIVASGGNEFIEAIKKNGLMEPIKKIIREAGPDPEKETNSILLYFGGRDKNRGKTFTPDLLFTRLRGYFKEGLDINRPNYQTSPTKWTPKLNLL